MTLEILFASEQRAFTPGKPISGRMRWRFDKAPQWIELRLFWFTEGKGTQDLSVVEKHRETDCPMSGERPFSFIAPAHPPSCSGKLVSIRWALEMVSDIQEQVPCIHIIIAPNAQEIVLGSVT